MVMASGRHDDVLTPEHVRELYGVDAEIVRHSGNGAGSS